ncbi:kinase-like domain-containing protein [Roridomyces roridus]|uniref:non-specific serine/threonine protein kinase n=1 Tax=Roridomyces roridus TaxID=1738132 RepID=A0AAD7FEG9_9AGAR|nr:kinase-like domain-containing protein [Roridomyces roridus]
MFSTVKSALRRQSSQLTTLSKTRSGKTPSTTARGLSVDDFDGLSKLGQGSFGNVFLVREKKTSRHYALKQLARGSTNAHVEQCILRTNTQDPASPSSLLPLVASWSDPANHNFLTEWYSGDLASFLGQQPLFPELTKLWIAQLVVAVEALHERGVVHRDIKPENIFVTAAGNLVLGDLGLAKPLGDTSMFGGDEPDFIDLTVDPNAESDSFFRPSPNSQPRWTTEQSGTALWASPAQHSGTPYRLEADVFSLGLLLFEMCTARMPFGTTATNRAEPEYAYAWSPVQYYPDDEVDALTKDLIDGMLAKVFFGRLTIKEVKAHRYFQGLDWNVVACHQVPVPWVPTPSVTPTDADPMLLISPGLPSSIDEFFFVSDAFLASPISPPSTLKSRFKRVFQRRTVKTRATGIVKNHVDIPVPYEEQHRQVKDDQVRAASDFSASVLAFWGKYKSSDGQGVKEVVKDKIEGPSYFKGPGC